MIADPGIGINESMRKNSIKHSRINAEVLRELSAILRDEVHDPRVGIMTSVSGVETAPDLKTCKVRISVLGSEEEKDAAMAAVKNASGFIRSRLAANLNLRNTPELIFIRDDSIEYGVRMTAKIDEVIKEMPVRDEDEQSERCGAVAPQACQQGGSAQTAQGLQADA